MKILQVNTVIRGSSVGRIMADLYEAIKDSGNEARVAVGREPMPEGYEGILIGNKGDFYQHVVKNFLQGESGFGSAEVTKKFLSWIDEEKPDLIHLHNIHGFYLQVEMLFEYIKKRNIPVVWTLHDCWSFTGHCAYYDFAACEKWKTGCHTCMQHAKVYPYAIFKDNTTASYARKRKAFCGVKNLTIVTPSHWLKEQVEQSFLREYPVAVIPNGVDLSVFSPADAKDANGGKKNDGNGINDENGTNDGNQKNDRNETDDGNEKNSRNKTNNSDKSDSNIKTILGVANIWELRKGLVYFEKLAGDLPDDYRVELIGVNKKQKKELKKKYGNKIIARERTANVGELAEAYRNAAVFVNATLEDNFPTTNLEALACGTPVVTYATGGSGESVTEETGIVVRRGSYDKLFEAVLDAAEGRFSKEDCLKRAKEFDKETRYEEYLKLYEEVLGNAADE